MAKGRRDLLTHGIRIGLIVVAISMVTLFLDWLGVFQRPESMLYDSRMVRTASFHGPSPRPRTSQKASGSGFSPVTRQ